MDRRTVLAVGFVSLASCVAAGAGAARPSGVRSQAVDPATFVPRVTNPWHPLKPGTVLTYRGVEDGEPSRDVVTVTHRTKVILGVRTTVVSDLLYVQCRLAERTTDWFAQDTRGTVWYFGEATAELDEKGRVTSREGSWQAGVDGARQGVVMPARPKVGQSFRQEFSKGQAEDHFQILSLSAEVRVPFVSSRKALLTKEWTPLEPGVIDHKFYVRGVGLVREVTVKGGKSSAVLVSVKTR